MVSIELLDAAIQGTAGFVHWYDKTIVSIGYVNGVPFDVDKERVHVIGDADKVSNLLNAITQANDLVIQF